MVDRIRVGILSFAHYHANFWSEAFRDSPLAEFVGIWDDDAARGAEAATRFGVRFSSDLEALLDVVDAVGITSETAHHARLVEAAARRGRHVLCEKPLAATTADCERIAHAVQAAGITFMQSFPKRFDPVNHELRRMATAGELGRLFFVRVRHGHHRGPDPDFAREWFFDPALGGLGTLLDEGIHGADFLRWLLGEPESVTAMTSSAALGFPTDDLAVAVFRFPPGVLAELSTSWSFAAADNSVELYGLLGTAVLTGVDLGSRDITTERFLKTYRRGQEKQWTVSPIVPRFKTGGFHQQNPLNFLDALSRGVAPPVTLEDGWRAVEMILAAYRAAETGQVQAVPPSRGAG